MTKSQLIEVDFRSELKERESEIELLQDTFKLIASELNLEKVFDTVAKRALQLVDAETILIPILDKIIQPTPTVAAPVKMLMKS